MDLTPCEIDKLHVYQFADLTRRRRDHGTKLDVSDAILEAARDGSCRFGVRRRITLLQFDAPFPDGSELISCHDPIAG